VQEIHEAVFCFNETSLPNRALGTLNAGRLAVFV
jgi:hypothetical protein